MDICIELSFSAGHSLPRHSGACRRFHGHNYKLLVTVSGSPDAKTGMIFDFEDLKGIVIGEAVGLIDHQNLNDILPNPTAEHIVVFLWEKLSGKLDGLKELKLYETPEYAVVYRGE